MAYETDSLTKASVDTREAFAKSPPGTPDDSNTLVNTLESYRQEADNARRAGINPRDGKWEENINLYWNRHDFSQKANWQAKEVMPEVPSFVDRFAAAMKEALVSSPDGFYTIIDPADQEKDLAQAIKRVADMWLTQVGRNQNGTCLAFPAVFEEQVKLGALMACSSVTTWKNDVEYGRVSIEAVDPRFIWLDHTYRNLYRIRRVELDLHDLQGMLDMKDANKDPIFNVQDIAALVSSITQEDQAKREALTGTGQQITSSRKPIILDEYLATILDNDGRVLYDKGLAVVANNRFLIRGPEANPYWHGKDWLTYAPLVTAPLSVYGRPYMEDFGSVAKTFTELTNMILDAVHVSSLRAFAVVPGMLADPGQLAEGITPNKMFLLEDGLGKPEDFAKALELGNLPPEAVQVWQAIKNELREAAGINEIGLGQFAPKGRTSAYEVASTQESSSALIRSVAQNIETRWLDLVLDLLWKTGLQHMRPDDKRLAAAAGPDMYQAIYANRKELVKRPMTFQARGISALIQKSRMLKSVLTVLQVISSNPALLQAFMQEVDVQKLIKLIFFLSDIDLSKITLSERDKLIRQVAQPLLQGQQGGNVGPGSPGQQEMKGVAQSMGVANG